jgi:hypothetical protein
MEENETPQVGQSQEQAVPVVQPEVTVTPQGSWRDKLPEDIREANCFQSFKSEEDVYRSYVAAQQLIGRKGIVPPQDGDGPEIWDKYYHDLGRPEAPDKYEFQKPEGLPEGLTYSEELEKEFRQFAYEKGLTGKQAKDAFDFYHQVQIKQLDHFKTQTQDQIQSGIKALQDDWKADFNNNLLKAEATFKKLADAETIAEVEKSGLGNNPKFIKLFYDISEKYLAEDKLIDGGVPVSDTLQSKIKDLEADPAYWDKMHPKHKDTVTQLKGLYRQAYPE